MTRFRIFGAGQRWFYGVCLIALTMQSGCGRVPHSDRPTGVIQVRVGFGDQKVTQGFINFASPQTGLGGGAEIGADGTAYIKSVPVGRYVVTVTPPLADQSNPNPPTVDYPTLPKKYRSEATSTLVADVQTGTNELQFDLKN